MELLDIATPLPQTIIMETSYFAKYKGDKGVSIALYTPRWWSGRQYTKLAPPASLLNWWKSAKSPDWSIYSEMYAQYVLAELDAEAVVTELGIDSVLLCYEKSGSHCHRYLVSQWIEKSTGIIVPEIGEKNVENSKEEESTDKV